MHKVEKLHPIDPVCSGEHPIDPVCSGEHPIDPVCSGEHPIDPVCSGEHPIDPVYSGEHPIDLVYSGEPCTNIVYNDLLVDNYMLPQIPRTQSQIFTSSMVSYSYHCCCMHVCVCVGIMYCKHQCKPYWHHPASVAQLAPSMQPASPNWNQPNGDGRPATPS